MKSLRCISLHHCDITDHTLLSISLCLSLLQKLSIFNCKMITCAGLSHISGLMFLKELFIDSRNVKDVGMYHISKIQSLQDLELECLNVSDIGLNHLSNL